MMLKLEMAGEFGIFKESQKILVELKFYMVRRFIQAQILTKCTLQKMNSFFK